MPLLILGRVAVIKSVLFPKLSYLFQMLPLLPSKHDLVLLRSIFTTFLWQGKKPCIAFTKLTLPRDKGGYGLPDVLTFSQTIMFRHISDWLLGSSTFSDFTLDEAVFSPYSPSALLHLPKNTIPPQTLLPTFCSRTRIPAGALSANVCKGILWNLNVILFGATLPSHPV